MSEAVTDQHVPQWSDAVMVALTRDTRHWLVMDGDFPDMRPHALILYSLAKWVCWPDPHSSRAKSRPQCVEIGVRSGVSTLPILQAMSETGGTLFSVDCDAEQAEIAKASIEAAGLSAQWQFACTTSDDFAAGAPPEIDFLLIDGDHSEEQVRKDVANYLPRVRRNGICVLHDYFLNGECTQLAGSGVAVVVQEIQQQNDKYEVVTLPWSYGLTIVRCL